MADDPNTELLRRCRMSLSPRESASFIAKHAKHVSISKEAIPSLAKLLYDDLTSGRLHVSVSHNSMHPRNDAAAAARWTFLVDSLNFSFWTDGDQYIVTFEGKAYTGYMALCAAMNRAIKEGVDLLDANVLLNLSPESVKHIFRSDNSVEIPLLETRFEIMQSHARTLLNDYNGCFTNCINICKGSAARLIGLVCSKFPSFNDVSVYEGVEVTFQKRAQILVADLWLAFEGESFGHFEDINVLTAFADYRVPQVLAFFEVLQYDTILRNMIQNKELLENGSTFEQEIRGTSLHAIELLVEETRKLLSSQNNTNGIICNSVLADSFLWLYRREHSVEVDEKIQMHRTRCIYY